ncbi:hypothetical protein [Lactococcus sp.]|uniref:hypothetical protein n=1 Tax=Lactococcus sp. TaxID=44273 RepID=UPI0035B08DD7
MMSSSYGYGDMMGSFGISTGAILILILIVAVVYLLCKNSQNGRSKHDEALEDEIRQLKKEIQDLKKDRWKDY